MTDSNPNTVKQFKTANKRTIYSIPLRVFPALVTNVFVIDDGNSLTMVDCGSGFRDSNPDLLAGVEAVGEQFGANFTLADIDTILITHGHIDHYGALPFVREHNKTAQIGVHVLDRAVLENNHERATVAASRLQTFFEHAGVDVALHENLMQVYHFGKTFYQSLPVQFLLEEGQSTPNGIEVYHVPGHCPGLVCLQVDDVLLTADHILSRTTPHQAPESITANMGLRHYYDSLDKIARLDGISLALGCHEDPMSDVRARIADIKQMHERRLQKVRDSCTEPKTIQEVSMGLFGEVKNHHILLALEEAGAHVEYLHQRGELLVTNLDELKQNAHAAVHYVCR